MLKRWIAVVICGGLVLAACASGANTAITEVVPTLTQIVPTLEHAIPPEVDLEIRTRISELLEVPIESIQIETIEKMDWPNGCLGLPEPGEPCTEVITPGWLVVFSIDDQEYRFRVNETGTVVRREP